MKILVSGDYHIEESGAEECIAIGKEICSYDADIMVNLGDLFEKKSPTPYEVYLATGITKSFTDKFSEVAYITGNHTEISPNHTNINYLEFIANNLRIVGNETVLDDIYFGHYMTDKSTLMHGKSDRTVDSLSKHRFALLGHQHSFQKLGDNVWHLGSTRWVHFGESGDQYKYFAMIEDDKIEFIKVKSAVPMCSVSTLADLKNIPVNTKVYYKIKSFEQLKDEIQELKKVQNNYNMFRIKVEPIIKQNISEEVKGNKNLEETIGKWIETISDVEVKKELTDEFIEEGMYGN